MSLGVLLTLFLAVVEEESRMSSIVEQIVPRHNSFRCSCLCESIVVLCLLSDFSCSFQRAPPGTAQEGKGCDQPTNAGIDLFSFRSTLSLF